MKRLLKFLRSFLISLGITLLLLEFVSFVLLKKAILLHDIPTYSFKNARSEFWVEINPYFGVWHVPGSTYTQRRPCFETEYHANSFGMRDKEREMQSDKPRVVVLGDSYVEGYGVPDGQRLSDLLEKWRGKEHLNFGTTGGFGPTQYYEMYEHLAKNFSHQELLIGIFPKNDFSDDDIKIYKDSGLYRPEWVGTYPNYQLVYTSDKPRGAPAGALGITRGILREYTYLFNLYDYLYKGYKYSLKRVLKRSNGLQYAGYYDFTEEEWDRMRFNWEKILEDSKGKKVTFFMIPAIADLRRYDQEGEAPLSKKMKAFADAHNVGFVDLLPYMHDHNHDWESYFFTCEGHWSPYGNEVAAQYLLNQLDPNTAQAGTHAQVANP